MGRRTATSESGEKKHLLIVESPAKAKTIKKILGSDFTVKASLGHVRDIPSKGWGKAAFGIDFEHGYQPTYETIRGREKVLKELAAAAAESDVVYLAPDPDREGEAIAWHLQQALHLPEEKVRRVTFNAITKSAVLEAMKHPTKIDMNLVHAQQGRRVLDRIVGYSLSPFLWKKVTKGLSAGRVQSVAVRLIVDREREIASFQPQEYWRIIAELTKRGEATSFEAELVEWNGEKFALGSSYASSQENAHAIAEILRGATFVVEAIEEREIKGRPSPPFITSTLQQAASTRLSFSTQKTMRIAQDLYEGLELEGGVVTGLITYMRTDSTRIAPEALHEAREFIAKHYAPEYLPEKAQIYTSRKGAQDAHEAIRPTSVELTPDRVKPYLTPDQYKLYELIWTRFVASQMAPAIYRVTTVRIAADRGIFEAKGRRVVFDGYILLSAEKAKATGKTETDGEEREEDSATEKDTEQLLPSLTQGDRLDLRDLRSTQHFTQPPPRYTEASLVRALEKEGIGRPSTYAPIVQTIQERGYVRLEKRRFYATELGMAVTDLLMKHFHDIMDVQFTARMESNLDDIEEGKADWVKVVDDFYRPFEKELARAMKEAEALKGKPAPSGQTCPKCGSPMVIRYSKNGAFLGCEKYPDCKTTAPLPSEGKEGESETESEEGGDASSIPCPACGAPMTKKRGRFGEFLSCTAYPACKKTMPLDKEGKPAPLPEITATCDLCGKPMTVKRGRRGPFLACSGYPECTHTKPITKDGKVVDLPKVEGEVCEKCGANMIVRMSRRGPFLACSAYPKCRNAKKLPK